MAFFLHRTNEPQPVPHLEPPMPRIVLYARAADRVPSEQIDALTRALAPLSQHTLLGAYSDHASGYTSPWRRPGLRALLAAQARAPAEVLLLPALHHLTRDRLALPALLRALQQRGLPVRTWDELPTWPAPTRMERLSPALFSSTLLHLGA